MFPVFLSSVQWSSAHAMSVDSSMYVLCCTGMRVQWIW